MVCFVLRIHILHLPEPRCASVSGIGHKATNGDEVTEIHRDAGQITVCVDHIRQDVSPLHLPRPMLCRAAPLGPGDSEDITSRSTALDHGHHRDISWLLLNGCPGAGTEFQTGKAPFTDGLTGLSLHCAPALVAFLDSQVGLASSVTCALFRVWVSCLSRMSILQMELSGHSL